MSDGIGWYRSAEPPPRVSRTIRRALRDAIRGLLPEPAVAGRVIVLRSRRTFPKPTRRGFRAEYHGLFSEFHSVLGALVYARERGALGVRVEFDSPLYVDAARGSNWWTYFFEREVMWLGGVEHRDAPEARLDRVVTKYGRYGGFADIVQGRTPYLYPMTFGIDRASLATLVSTLATVRGEFREEAARLARTMFTPGAFVVGVHYRGTDAVRRVTGALSHYRASAVPYETYADEVRRVLETVAPKSFQVFVATDESAFVEHMRSAFPGSIVAIDAPRAGSDRQPVHLTASSGASPYEKGKSAILDSLLLASTHYVVKGRSNLSDASLVFNPELPYSFCPDVPLHAVVRQVI
jgi:hypothetical protein